MIKLFEVAPEDVWYDFDEEIYIEELFNDVVIYGNHHFLEKGNDTYLSIVKGDYYDDELGYNYEPIEMLEKVSGKEWNEGTLKGYSQGDWQTIYYTNDIAKFQLEDIENFYMGKVSEFRDEDDCCYYVPDDVKWKGKEAICKCLGFKPENTQIYKFDGWARTETYKEI